MAVVTGRAKWLPVRAIPEQPIIAAMGLDVIHYGRRCAAHPAVGIELEKGVTGSAPCTVVAALGRTGALGIVALVPGTSALDLTGTALTMRHDLPTGANMGRFRH